MMYRGSAIEKLLLLVEDIMEILRITKERKYDEHP
jgi:hypothetical protein